MGLIRLLALLVAFVFSACSSKPAFDGLQFQLATEPVSLDPALAEDGVSLRVLTNLMEGLMGYDSSGRLVKRLAETVDVGNGGRTYIFTIRKDARWSDGRQVVPEEFVAGIERSRAPGMPSKLASFLSPLKTVKASGAKLMMELDAPIAYWLDVLTLPVAMPWREGGVVTGPYRITEHRTDQYYVLEPNQYYRAAPKKSVMLRVVGDESTGVGLFERGLLDVLTKIPTLDQERLEKTGRVQVFPFVATYFLAFNTRKPPFDERKARLAVASAIDKQGVVKALGTGELPAHSWIPLGLEGYVPWNDQGGRAIVPYKFPEQVVASFDGSARNSLIMEKIQHDVLTKLGLKLSLVNMDWKTHLKSLATDPAPVFRFGWMAPFNDPISHLQAFTSKDPNNYTGWKNAEYDALVRKIAQMSKGVEREKKIREAQTLLVEREAVVIPILHYVQTFAVSSRVKCFKVNQFAMLRFDEITENCR